MKQFRLSTLSSVFILAGLISPSLTYAIECDIPIRISGQLNESLQQCNLEHSHANLNAWQIYPQPISIENSTFSINDSTIFYSSLSSNTQGLLHTTNSTLKIQNSDLSVVTPPYAPTIKSTNSEIYIDDSSIKNGLDTDFFEMSGGSLNINNSDLSTKLGLQYNDLLKINSSSKISINNSTAIANNIISDSVEGAQISSSQITINNSYLVGFRIFSSPWLKPAHSFNVIVNNNSILEGLSSGVGQIDGKQGHFNLTLDNSEWKSYKPDNRYITGSEVGNLILKNGNVTLKNEVGFQQLHILNNLIGSGTFTLNTDLANQQSDQIIINGLAEGSHKLDVKDSGNEPQAANGKVTLVKTSGNGEAEFSLLNRDYVDAGAYRYRLSKEQNDWVLSNKQAEPTKPAETTKPVAPITTTETVKPVIPTKPTAPTKPTETAKLAEATQTSSNKVMLSGTSNALVGLRQAQLLQLEQNVVGIHQRLGEQKQLGKLSVWARNVNTHSELAQTNTAANSHTSGFEQDSHLIQLGADVTLSDNWRLGGLVENSRSKIDFSGEYGSGKVKGQGVGLYLTYQGNDGFYLDNIAKYSRLKATSDYTNSQRYHGYSLSSEIGTAFELGKLTLTPNAQLAWHSLSGKENQDRLSSLYARVGARLATTFDMASWKLQPYFEINGISSKNRSSQVRVNQYAFDVASSRGRVENALGLNIAKGQHRFGIEAKTAYGKRLDQPFALQAIYRYQW